MERVRVGVLATVLVVVAVLLAVGGLVVRRVRVARLVGALDDAWFAGPVLVSPGVLGTNVLVVDQRGLRLLWVTGGERGSWTWAEVFVARAERLRSRGGLRWPGAVVDVEAGARLDLLFLTDLGIGTSRRRAEHAVAAVHRGIAAHRA